MRQKNGVFSLQFLARNGITAAVYVAVTYAFSFMSYGPVQFRLSEVMVFLAFINFRYIPGLTIGCFVANLLGPYGLIDGIFGGLATLYSVVMISLTPGFIKNKLLGLIVAGLWPVTSSVILAYEISWASGYMESILYWTAMIALGEFVVVTLAGVPIFYKVMQNKKLVALINNI